MKATSKKYSLLILEVLVLLFLSCFVLKNLRIDVNSTTVVITSFFLFLLFAYSKKIGLSGSRRYLILTLIFSVALATANNLGSHIHVDYNVTWSSLDKNPITTYSAFDILSVAIMTLVVYCAVNMLLHCIKSLSTKLKKRINNKGIPFWGPMIAIFICWLPYFILYYPGFIFGDSMTSIEQALGYWELSNHHPVMYTLFIRLCISIGNALAGSLKLGCALYTIFQMLFVSYALSRQISWISRHEYSGLKRPGYRGSGTIVPQQ